MKNKFKILSLFLSVAMMLSACNDGGDPSQNASSESSATDATDEEGNTIGSAELTDNRGTWEKLSDITSECSENLLEFDQVSFTIASVSPITDGKFLATSTPGEEEIQIAIIDLKQSTIVEKSVPCQSFNWHIPKMLSDYAVLYNSDTSDLTVYDLQLNEVDSKNITSGDSSSLIQLSQDDFLVCRYGSNTLQNVHIDEAGKISVSDRELLLQDNLKMQYVSYAIGSDRLLISCVKEAEELYNNTYYQMIYNLSDDSAVRFHVSEMNMVNIKDEKLIVSELSGYESSIYSFDTPNLKISFPYEKGAYPIDCSQSEYIYYYMSESETLNLYAYDTTTGNCIATKKISCEGYPYVNQMSEYDGVLVFFGSVNDREGVFACKMDPSTEIDSSYSFLNAPDYESMTQEVVDGIMEKYSVDIYFGNNAVKFFNGYVVVSETDEKSIYNAVVKMDSFLGKFPEGFVEELCEENEGIMRIYLTGKIIPDNSGNSINDAAAFVYQDDDGIETMVVDITQSGVDSTLAHEFMHIIENTVYQKRGNNQDRTYEAFDRMFMLNPDDFCYYYDYTDDDGNTLGYESSEYLGSSFYEYNDIDSVYFVDGYATTYPTEDYARLFEYLFTYTKDELPQYFNGANMKLKSAYLCACIRDAFDCITPETVLFWENSIEPEYNLEYFRENYDLDAWYQDFEGWG